MNLQRSDSKNKISYYLKRMAYRGFSESEVLDGCSIRSSANPSEGFRAAPDQYRKVISNMLRLTGCESLGLELGAEIKVSDLGVLGYATLSSTTLAQARTVIHRYHNLNEYLVLPLDHIHGNKWTCELKEMFPLGGLIRFATEEFITRAMALSSTLTDREFLPLEVHLQYPEPAYGSKYSKIFGCPIYFDQPKTLIHFDARRLDDPIVMADEDVFSLCDQLCSQLIKQQQHSDKISERIRYILLNMPGSFIGLNEMAEKLSISPRTLARRLRSEGITYQELINTLRKELALEYLSCTDLTPKEISYALGFSNVSNFRRAFKSWTGKKVSEYRQE
ncbi:AraC family transcriptional regulator [Parahaliea mediterranea]|uniref:AraC family transcriptional regulator n=1 Tax=Parahaliea mediterranea TaxID=651086 RepID=A0A939DG46_9GAMM|nr:AraC family transcriptional regulator [Parahaliea mediterranea]MBN7796912.1 AraC family transcriptional regulator [Parahaliea mediterranea]